MTLTDRGGTPALVVSANRHNKLKGVLIMGNFTQIGWYILKEDRVFRNDYECAAWYEDVLVKAGRYPVEVYDLRFYDDGRIDHSCGGAYVSMDGEIVSDYFATMYCGVPVGKPYDTTKNKGKRSEHHGYWYLYDIAHKILDGDTEFELLPEYEPREIHFEYNGEEHVTHGIFKKGV